ncbi:MAG: protein BatD [Gammaproteobacteria bacterium]|nr:MAG: protein BatD [Gammaproteobacteria bacterium]
MQSIRNGARGLFEVVAMFFPGISCGYGKTSPAGTDAVRSSPHPTVLRSVVGCGERREPHRRTLLVLLWLVLWLLLHTAEAGVSASVDRQTVYEGDTLTLTLESDAGLSGKPELSPLKKDFEVLSSGTFSSFSFNNGRQSSRSGWRIKLRPTRIGDLVIPSIPMGGDKTRPIMVHVLPVPPEVAKRNAEKLFVETEIDTGGRDPYVQQQVKLTVRLYYRVRILDGQMSEPQPDADVIFERLGKERRYETVRNGLRYQVIERDYAMFPQRSGELRVPSVVFNGRIAKPKKPKPRRRRSFGDPFFDRFFEEDPFDDIFENDPFFAKGEPVVARSTSKTLKVLPPPKEFKGQHWLPAADVKLYDSWSESPLTLRVGEPVTRVLALRAKGLEGSQLPEPELADGPSYKVYPEQPTTSNRVEAGWVVGEIQRAFAIVPQKAGKLVLPEVRVRWWDITQDKERETVLPRWELEVLPGAGGQTKVTPPPTAKAAPAPSSRSGPASPPASEGAGNPWQWWPWALALLVVLVLTGLWLARRPRQPQQRPAAAERPKSSPSRVKSDAAALRRAREDLAKACEAGEPRKVAAALLALAREQWPDDPPLDLPALARRRPDQAAAFEALDRALYGAGEPEANWRGLCEIFREGFGGEVPARASGDDEEMLPPLYPNASE